MGLGITGETPAIVSITAFAIAIWFWRSSTLRGRTIGSALCGLSTGLASECWVGEAARQMGASIGQSVSLQLALALWMGVVPMVAYAVILTMLDKRSATGQTMFLCVAVIGFESISTSAGLDVPWVRLGHALGTDPGLSQWISIGGVPLLSALMIALADTLARAAASRDRESVRTAIAVGAATLCLSWFGLELAGARTKLPPSDPNEVVKVLLIQPNFPRSGRWDDNLQATYLQRIASFTEAQLAAAPSAVDLVAWPENTITSPADLEPMRSKLRGAIGELGVPVITGMIRSAPEQMAPAETPDRYRNSILWLDPSGTVISSLDKTLPIPGFESHPSNGFARMLIELLLGDAMSTTPIAEGPESKSLGDSGEVVGILCFEALFPGIVQERLSPNSRFILNLADDSWISQPIARRQLAYYSRLRAIEFQLPMVRVAHSGLSFYADEFGRILEDLPPDQYASAIVGISTASTRNKVDTAMLLGVPISLGFSVWVSIGFGIRTVQLFKPG